MVKLSDDCRLAFCVGVGGVGKTTFAAALGLSEAIGGRRVLVLTADPARRLADALSVSELRNEASPISLPPGSTGSLHAAMLETQSSADEAIERVASDRAHAERVLHNRIYRAFSRTLSRSHAYASMERIYAALHEDAYDLVIVDTPPAQSAIEVLDAPLRLSDFLGHRVIRWFSHAAEATGARGGALGRSLLKTISGESLVGALTEFLSEMSFLSDGFLERARGLGEFMRSDETEFVLVCAADPTGALAGRSVAEALQRLDLSLSCVVFNRAFVSHLAASCSAIPPRPASYPAELSELAPELEAMHQAFVSEQARRDRGVRDFYEGFETSAPGWRLPESTRPLGRTDQLAEWIRKARPVAVPR
jgi:arsenite-transporting ATPase